MKIRGGDEIPYYKAYEKDCENFFTKSPGDEGFVFTDENAIQAQRAVLGQIIKNIGTNVLSGSGIMNVTLPINIFDPRSLLDVFAHQHRQLEYFMELCLNEKMLANRMKWVRIIVIS